MAKMSLAIEKTNTAKTLTTLLVFPALLLAGCTNSTAESAENPVPTGYSDTPYLPDSPWRVHDIERPRPGIITPGEAYGAPPSDAIILFDGSDLSEWRTDSDDGSLWPISNGAMTVPVDDGITQNLISKRAFGDVQLHIEWRSPESLVSNSQGRGNSGVFFLEKYEIQILDSYDNPSYADGQASALYGSQPPLVNASRKPGEWQVYDIIFEAPEFDVDGRLLSPAYVTVFHNHILTQYRQAYLGTTVWREVAMYTAHEPKGSILLQDHSNPVSYRNIWVRELSLKPDQ